MKKQEYVKNSIMQALNRGMFLLLTVMSLSSVYGFSSNDVYNSDYTVGIRANELEFTNDDFTARINPFVEDNKTVTLYRTLRNTTSANVYFELASPDTNTILLIDDQSSGVRVLGARSRVKIKITFDASNIEEVGMYEEAFMVNHGSEASSLTESFTVNTVLEVTDQPASFPEGLVMELLDVNDPDRPGLLDGILNIRNDSGSPIVLTNITTDLGDDVDFEIATGIYGEDFEPIDFVNGSNLVLRPEEFLVIEFFENPGNTGELVGRNLIIESNATNSLLTIPFVLDDDEVLSLDSASTNVIDNEQIVTVAPNPTINATMIYVKGIKNHQISSRLTNVLGQDMNITKRITWSANGRGVIEMSDLKQGYYILTITDQKSGTVHNTKLIKN